MSKKYWDKKVSTTDKKDSWQETYNRDSNIPAKAIQALDTLLGFSGSWMGALASGYQSSSADVNLEPQNPKWRVSHLGAMGYPELNFIPYNYRTNAIGSKGGSLIGHPISFSVVGATTKTLEYGWSVVADNEIVFTAPHTLLEAFGDLSLLIDSGLFFTIPETGGERTHTIMPNAIVPKEEYGDSAKFEIFRVTAVTDTKITFDKPLSNFFEASVGDTIQGIMMFQPYSTRMVAVPDSGDKGAEKVFMVVSPEHSAFNDLNAPLFDTNFESYSLRGAAHQRGYALPIPLPTKNLTGQLERATTKSVKNGAFVITDLPVGHGVSNGDILHITSAKNVKTDIGDRLLGWFEVVEDLGATGLILRREVEINANTGERDYGEDLFIDSSLPQTVVVEFSVHEPVSQLFQGEYNADKVEACRLTNLIDPQWVDRTTKRVADDAEGTLFGGAPAKADRAIFTTNKDSLTNADAGNLLDLGFRMVLFPAKEVGGNAVPDYSKPITSNEVILDPSLSEKQYIEVDYSAGTVTLSHAPTLGGELTPNGIVGLGGNNPRGEVVLFACCVPYSMEQGQTGTGVSISGGRLDGADHNHEDIQYASPLGDQVIAKVISDFGGGSYAVETYTKLPPNAHFEIMSSDQLDTWTVRVNDPVHPTVAKGFYRDATLIKETNTNSGTVYLYAVAALTDGFVLTDAHSLRIRKDSFNAIDVREDVTYGSAWRSDKVRFAFADIDVNVDGSITVFPTATKGPAQELRSQFPLAGNMDWGRVAFNSDTQRWTVGSPTYQSPTTNQIGLEVLRGKTYLADTIVRTEDFTPLIVGLTSITANPNDTTDALTVTYEADSVPLNTGTSLLFGESLVSKDLNWTTETLGGSRLVIALLPFDGTNKYWEGLNPTHWLSVSIPDNQDLTTTVSEINTLAQELGFGDIATEVAGDTNEGRIMLTERSVEVMPSYNYLATRVINDNNPLTFADGSSMTVTLRSANPKYAHRWVTFKIVTDNTTVYSAQECAAYLNRRLYDISLLASDYVGNQLYSAGFIPMNASDNPYLNGSTSYPSAPTFPTDEHEFPILFMAHDDPRHPAHGDNTHPDYEKVLFFCGGRGIGESKNLIPLTLAGNPFPLVRTSSLEATINTLNGLEDTNLLANVLVEVTEDYGKTGQNLCTALGFGAFSRFGLFFASTNTTSLDVSTQLANDLSILSATGGLVFGSSFGTISSVRYLGTSEFIASSTTQGFLYAKKNSGRNTPAAHKEHYTVEGHRDLSRWIAHQKSYGAVDLTVSSSAGWYRSWMGFTNRVVEGFEFSQPLSVGATTEAYLLHTVTDSVSNPFSDSESLKGYYFKSPLAEGVFVSSTSAWLRFYNSVSVFDPQNPTDAITLPFEAKPSTMATHTGHQSTFSLLQNNLGTNYNKVGDSAQLPNATYMTGGHIDLFSSEGARTAPSGISLGTTIGTGNENLTFLTHIEHGVFQSLYGDSITSAYKREFNRITGLNEDFAIPQGQFQQNTKFGGVSGVRFSGDTNIWLENLSSLDSGGELTARFLVSSSFNGLSLTDNDLESGSLFLGLSDTLSLLGGSHGIGVHASTNATNESLEEATIVLGLTQKNLASLAHFEGALPLLFNSVYSTLDIPSNLQQKMLKESKIIQDLQGTYIEVTLDNDQEDPPHTHLSNTGVWRITQAPVVFSGGLFAILAPQSELFSNQVVSVLALRVERYSSPHLGFKASDLEGSLGGYGWALYADKQASMPIYTADVVETGGVPTNVPSSVNGFTLDPQALGHKALGMHLLGTDGTHVAKTELYGIRPHTDSVGKPRTTAWFSIAPNITYQTGGGRAEVNVSSTLPTLSSQSYRGVIRSWSDATMSADLGEEQGNFIMNKEGRVVLSHKKRLGLGVIIDGGLGVVHATGFRSNPRPTNQLTMGGLTVYGGAYPFTSDTSQRPPVKVTNLFDTTEFIDDAYVVSPKGALIFEDARAVQGLARRIQENLLVSHLTRPLLSRIQGDERILTPNNALLPYNMGGVVFKGSGVVRYTRGYNPLSSNSSALSSHLGKANNNGTKGMDIPNYGMCFLLPKGAPTTKGIGKANYRSNTVEGETPLDVPLYEFVQGLTTDQQLGDSHINGVINMNSVHSNNYNQQDPDVITGTGDTHEVNSGGIYQATAPSNSRRVAPYNNSQPINLMEGMIVENKTNGTFYTIGEIGRIYNGNPDTNTGGNGQVIDDALVPTGEMVGGSRPITQGSRIVRSRQGLFGSTYTMGEEVFFDLNPLVGYKGTHEDFAHGFGDRTDKVATANKLISLTGWQSGNLGNRVHVRSLSMGSELRITPNVEFVPQLGEHGVDGGLLPPYTQAKDGLIKIPDADAVFYSMSHDFKKAGAQYGAGDIGKFLYICGTDSYQYTGWWVIIDVIENFIVQKSRTPNLFETVLKSVAVVRKWNRSIEREGDLYTNNGALPLEQRSPRLRIMSNHQFDKVADSRTWFDPDNCSDIVLTFTASDGTVETITVPNTFLAGKDIQTIVNDLNSNANYNGSLIFAGTALVRWELDGAVMTSDVKHRFACIEVYLANPSNTNPLAYAYWKNFTGYGSSLHGSFSSNTSVITNSGANIDPLSSQQIGQVGIFSFVGINSAVDTGWGDRNNSALMEGLSDFVSYSAARGLRWVESHPMTEENVGSYLHLARLQAKRWDSDNFGFVKPSARGVDPTWVSRYPTQLDIEAGTASLTTDIFRINRCPTTKDLLVGGDCETYLREIAETQDIKKPIVYSPLGLDYGRWQDATTGVVETIELNSQHYDDPVVLPPMLYGTEYLLQPIARERIVSVNPSSMSSAEILEAVPAIDIDQIKYLSDFSPSAIQNLYEVRCAGTSDQFEYRLPSDALSIGTPVVFRGTGLSIDGKVGYVLETTFTQWETDSTYVPTGDENKMLIKLYIPTGWTTISPNPTTLINASIRIAEGVRPLSISGMDLSKPFKLRSSSDITLDGDITALTNTNTARDYQWTPASRWWEKQMPYAYLGWQNEANTSHERSPAILRVDLTEAYTQAQQTGAGVGSHIEEKRPRGVRLNRIWVNFGLWGNPAQVGVDPQSDERILGGYQHFGGVQPSETQAITFNLKVEIPNQEDSYPTQKGKGLLPFGGRAPTMSATNMTTPLRSESATLSQYEIPLYVNREAGELSPNVTDRFRSKGVNHTNSDWLVGSAEFGLGIGSNTDDYTWRDLTHNSGTNLWVGNASTVAVWGGIDAHAFASNANLAGSQNQLVKASTSLRDSMVAVNPLVGSNGTPPALQWDTIDTNNPKDLQRSLHKNALSGLTITHVASSAAPPSLTTTSADSCPHAFSVALTPIGQELTATNANPEAGAFMNSSSLHGTGRGLDPQFQVGNWLESLAEKSGGKFSGSFLPEGAKVWLEITLPNTLRDYGTTPRTSNGAWVGQVLCSFDVETADGTAMTYDVKKLTDE